MKTAAIAERWAKTWHFGSGCNSLHNCESLIEAFNHAINEAVSDARKDLEQERDTLQRSNAELAGQVESLRALVKEIYSDESGCPDKGSDGRVYQYSFGAESIIDDRMKSFLCLQQSNALKPILEFVRDRVKNCNECNGLGTVRLGAGYGGDATYTTEPCSTCNQARAILKQYGHE